MLDFVKTSSADFLSLELNNVLIGVAEAAVGLVLFQNNSIAVNEDLNGVRAGDTQMLAYFLWNNYSSELIDISDNTCRFHSPITFLGNPRNCLVRTFYHICYRLSRFFYFP